VSLLSPELRVALLPHRAGLAAGRKAPAAREAQDGGLQALDELLAEHHAGSLRGGARVTLSHHHARLFLVPPPPVRLRQREMRPWLDAQLADALGGNAADWRLTWDLAPPGHPILVAAMENALLDGLVATLGRHGLGLAGVRPWLADVWNRRRQLGRAIGWYALLEPGRMTVLRLLHGQPVILRQRAAGADIGADMAADLGALLARESLLAGLEDGGDLWLERAGVNGDWSSLGTGHRIHELAGPADPALAMLS
jgi:hypothetical protein